MNRHGLRTRILIYSVLPLLIVGLAAMTYFVFSGYAKLNTRLTDRGREILLPLATGLSYAMAQGNEILAQGLVNEFHRQNSREILAVAAFDRDNNMLVTSSTAPEIEGFRLDPRKGEHIFEADSVQYADSGIIMRMPVYAYNEADMLKLYLDRAREPSGTGEEEEEGRPSFTSDKISYPRPVAGYVCIYLQNYRVELELYSGISLALVILGLGVMFSLLFGVNLNRIIVDPINRLTTTIYEIREGNVNTKVNGVMIGELERLRNYINSMADSMSEYHNQMQYSVDEATNDLRHTLELLDEQNKELDSALGKANEASKIKSEFLANMSHELRTPLNGIIGFAQQLYKTPLKDSQSEYLGTIERSAKNLLSIVNNILDFSKLEAGKLSFEEIPFSLRKVCYDTVNLLTPAVYQKGIELTVNVDPDVSDYLIGDPVRIGQVLTNLLGNAVKFTQSGNVALRIARGTVPGLPAGKINLAVSVQDTGIGIDPEKQKTLFKPFTQADSSISRRYGGTGLGLIITSHLIEQMGGRISLRSEPGQGTTFDFGITLTRGAAPAVSARTPEEQALRGRRSVVIENNTWVRDSVRSILQELGLEVFAVSATGAISALASADTPDYIVIGQPAGFDFSRLLTTFNSINTAGVQKVIIAVSTMDEKVRRRLEELSPKVTVLAKPLNPEKVLGALLAPAPAREAAADEGAAAPAGEGEDAPAGPAAGKDLLPASVLAVDDNPVNLALIKALLGDLVTDVYTAATGHDAIELCMHTDFDLIFMDIQMPVMDGLTTMKNIRKIANNAATPVVAVTALVVKEEQDRFIREGMSDYLSKPLDEDLLEKIVRKYLAKDPAPAAAGEAAAPDAPAAPPPEAPGAGPREEAAPGKAPASRGRKMKKLKKIGSIDPEAARAPKAADTAVPPADPAVAAEPEPAPETAPPGGGLWTEAAALERAARKRDLAAEMLEGLLASLPGFERDLEELPRGDLKLLAPAVHKFAGSAVYCGMPKVKALCNAIEKAIREGRAREDIEPELFELEDLVGIIKRDGGTWLKILREGAGKP